MTTILEKPAGTERARPTKRSRKIRKKAGLGIDIGSFTTKIAHYDPGGSRKLICVAVPTLAGTFQAEQGDELGDNGIVAENHRQRSSDDKFDFSRWSLNQIDSLAERIRGAIGSELNTARVRASLSMEACDLRSVAAYAREELSRDEIVQRLQSEIKDNRRRRVAILDSQQEQNRVKALSVPEELTDGIAVGLDAHGVTPQSIEGQPWTLARLVPAERDTIHTVVDWGYSQPTLVCCFNGQVQYVRRLKAGSIRDLIEPIMTEYELDSHQAIRWLELTIGSGKTTGGADIRSESILERAIQCSRRLAAEIDAALEFVRWKNPDEKLGPVTLAGGGAAMLPMVSVAKQTLGCEAAVWEHETEDVSPVFAQAIALAEDQR